MKGRVVVPDGARNQAWVAAEAWEEVATASARVVAARPSHGLVASLRDGQPRDRGS